MGLITDLFKNVIVAKQVYNLITFSAAFIVFLIIFIVVGLPWFIILGFIAIGLIFVALSIFQIKRTLSVNLEEKPIPPESSITKSSLKGEKVLASIFGIIRSARQGYEVLGVGKMSNPENAILITNKRVILFAVPVAGEGKSVADADFSMMNVLFNRQSIEEKGKQMVAKMTPQKILDFNPVNYEIPFDKIDEVKISSFWGRGVSFRTIDEKKSKYSVRDKYQIEQIRQVLSQYIPGKVN